VIACFADTFFFLALLNAADREYHERARAANRIDRPIITSEFIILELADHLCDLKNRRLFCQLLDAIRGDARYQIVAAGTAVLNEAVDLYRQREDKQWSLTDCTSIVIMTSRKLTDVLTADHHFEQAGFKSLLK
jgi:predicted nucleic acid-binding protein